MIDFASEDGAPSPWSRPVRELLARMTLEEKAAQISATVLTAGDDTPPVPGIGIVYLPTSTPDGTDRLAAFRAASAADRLGIPVLPLAIGPDLDRASLPPLGRVATWDLRLAERMAACSARSRRAEGLYGHLVPAGATSTRGDAESGPPTVSDPVLAATFAAAEVHGAQGRTAGRLNPIDAEHVAVLTPLGVWPEGHWHERVLRTQLLSAAEAAVRGGAAAVVPTPAGNAGVPTHTDGWLLHEVLRREWRFRGVILAHPGAVDALDTTYRIAGGPDQAIALALEAGVDVVGNGSEVDRLVSLVRSGAVSSWLVDDAVAAVLTLKFRLGLLGAPRPATSPGPGPEPAPEDSAGMARTAFTRSLVLLTDPAGVLPLTRARIVDVRPGTVDSPDVVALADALAVARPGIVVRTGAGPERDGTEPADVVVVLAARPEDAVRSATGVVATGRRCVVVLTGDRVLDLHTLAATTATVLVCWRPIGEHAAVLADVLTGRAEPGGRLPLALPPGSGPGATFPLGHGCGYTTFDYSRLVISPAVLDGGAVLRVRCWVTNTGRRPGRDVVQVYLANPVGRTVVTDGITLGAFCTVEVNPGQSVPVTVRLPLDRLAVWNRTMRHILEPGTVDVLVGRSAADIRLRGTVTVAAHPSHWRG